MRAAIEPNPDAPIPGMSQAVRVGNQIHVSGQVALDADGHVVGPGDPAMQAAQCFANLTAVLAAGGATADDVVLLRCFLVDPAAYPAYAEAKAQFLAGVTVPPAGTAVVVSQLLVPELLMEVEALAELEGP